MQRHRMTGTPSCGTLEKGGDGDGQRGRLSSLRAFTLNDPPALRGSWQCDGGCILEAVSFPRTKLGIYLSLPHFLIYFLNKL